MKTNILFHLAAVLALVFTRAIASEVTSTDASKKPDQRALILTPAAPATPRINGASVFGVRPEHPFLYTIPATGNRPMTFAVRGLPEGLTLDASTGRITGRLLKRGEHKVVLEASNALGVSTRDFKIVVGDVIALTPPLGWNSWNCFADDVSDGKIRAAADAMISSGLADHGWTYINIDDCWQAGRDGQGRILSNEKFRGIRLVLEKDELKILANNPEQEEAEDVVSVEYPGAPLEIGFNVSYLVDVLSVMNADAVHLVLTDANSSALIHTGDTTSSVYVVMPMRL